MYLEIDRLYLSGISESEEDVDFDNTNTDVIVVLNNGQKYIAAFFTIKNVEVINLQNEYEGRNLEGKYFWAKNMVLVARCDPDSVEAVVKNLIEEGDFKEVFKRIF